MQQNCMPAVAMSTDKCPEVCPVLYVTRRCGVNQHEYSNVAVEVVMMVVFVGTAMCTGASILLLPGNALRANPASSESLGNALRSAF